MCTKRLPRVPSFDVKEGEDFKALKKIGEKDQVLYIAFSSTVVNECGQFELKT